MNQEERPPEEPQNLFEWLWRLKRYEAGIFVRVKNEEGKPWYDPEGGSWTNASLAQLDPKTWAEKVAKFLEEGALPVRVKEEAELVEVYQKKAQNLAIAYHGLIHKDGLPLEEDTYLEDLSERVGVPIEVLEKVFLEHDLHFPRKENK